jgi:hypothetical protein
VTVHAKNTLGCPGIAEILNASLAIPAFETIRAECLIASQDSQILDFIST